MFIGEKNITVYVEMRNKINKKNKTKGKVTTKLLDLLGLTVSECSDQKNDQKSL